MALTVNDVIDRLQIDTDDVSLADMNFFLGAAIKLVQNHVKAKFDAESEDQQLAIVLLCGYYAANRELGKDMSTNGSFLPDPVLAILNPNYVPLVI